MASRSPLGRSSGLVVGLVLVAGAILACGPDLAPASRSPDDPAPTVLASPPLTVGPSPSLAGRDAPPDALLGAEGGDPVTGQLGSFLWFQTGSDSPWLQGAPLAVGAGEPLTLTLSPDGDIRAWGARYVPAGADGPAGAITLGDGTGTPRFAAPGAGVWTVEVMVEFASGVGDASYFWRVEVE